MRMKMVCDDRTLREISNEFLALKKAQKIRDRTLSDYRKYIDKFLAQSENSLDVEILKAEILDFFAEIPKTSPARFNHPYGGLIFLKEMKRKRINTPTIIITQYEIFGEGSKQLTSDAIDELCKKDFQNYLGLIIYSSSKSEWKEKLVKMLGEI